MDTDRTEDNAFSFHPCSSAFICGFLWSATCRTPRRAAELPEVGAEGGDAGFEVRDLLDGEGAVLLAQTLRVHIVHESLHPPEQHVDPGAGVGQGAGAF